MNDWLSRVDSQTVLWGQMIVYTIYCLAIISLVAWFATRLTKKPDTPSRISPKLFYGWVIFLIVVGVGLHITTALTIPWVGDDLAHTPVDAAHTFEVDIANHEWINPATGQPVKAGDFQVPCNELVQFRVTSQTSPDNPEQPALTYGFGIFVSNGNMVAQMQVVPGHTNDMDWTFITNGEFTIRSTEYSGPNGVDVQVPGAIVVTGCE